MDTNNPIDRTNFYAYEGEDGKVVFSGNFYYAWGIPTELDAILRQSHPVGTFTTLEEATEALRIDRAKNLRNKNDV